MIHVQQESVENIVNTMYACTMARTLNLKTLKQQVYEYLSREIRTKRLKPGEKIHLDRTADKLGVSRTPLREALMQLEMEGFVTITPRVGIVVNRLTMTDIREYYQVIGSLEAAALRMGWHRITDDHLEQMSALNDQMLRSIEKGDFASFYRLNVKFHDVYIGLAENSTLHGTVNNLKRRLYDFLPADRWIREWETESLDGHALLKMYMERRDLEKAMHLLTDITWNFEVHAYDIARYYGFQPPDQSGTVERINPYRRDMEPQG